MMVAGLSTAEVVLFEAYVYADAALPLKATDHLALAVDHLLCQGNLSVVGEILDRADVEHLPAMALSALLVLTRDVEELAAQHEALSARWEAVFEW